LSLVCNIGGEELWWRGYVLRCQELAFGRSALEAISGGIADARGILAAFALGAAAVQIGTAYLHRPEAQISPLYRQALKDAKDNETAITNVFTGRPARAIVNRFMREVGPMSDVSPEFPLAAATLAPLRAKSEMAGSADFTPLW
jgi:nitronate monooxygenase